MKISPSVALGSILLSFLLVPAGASTAADQKPMQDETPPAAPSPWSTWQFSGSVERVRSELLSLIKEQGLSLTRDDDKHGTFLTDLIEFDDKKFGVDVGVPPPKASYKYPYFQLNDMKSGRYGLEGRLTRASSDLTRLDLRANLEARAMDEKIRGLRWIPRASNGQVERYFFTRLSLRLLNPPADSSPQR